MHWSRSKRSARGKCSAISSGGIESARERRLRACTFDASPTVRHCDCSGALSISSTSAASITTLCAGEEATDIVSGTVVSCVAEPAATVSSSTPGWTVPGAALSSSDVFDWAGAIDGDAWASSGDFVLIVTSLLEVFVGDTGSGGEMVCDSASEVFPSSCRCAPISTAASSFSSSSSTLTQISFRLPLSRRGRFRCGSSSSLGSLRLRGLGDAAAGEGEGLPSEGAAMAAVRNWQLPNGKGRKYRQAGDP